MNSPILHQSSWALTETGGRIELYSSSHSSFGGIPSAPPERPILFVGGVHGDEPEGVRLATDLLGWLQSHPSPQSLNPWALIPCLNPDGYLRKQRTNLNGVDLNRNFPSKNWQAASEKNRYYPGIAPNSERETQALVAWVQEHRPSVIIHFHSWEPCVVYTGEPGKIWAETLAKDTPYTARADIGYPTPGSLGDYGWFELGIPVICVEAQEHSDLQTLWPIFAPGLQRILSDRSFASTVEV